MAEQSNTNQNQKENDIIGRIYFNKFKVTKKIGQGSFGQVFQGVNLKNNEPVALKFELKSENNNLLETEAYRLIYLKGEGIPKVLCYGNNKKYNILVLQLLGKSLEQLFNLCGKKLSLKTTVNLGTQMIERIKFVHENFHLHRDIKPDNFVMGTSESENKVFVIDFGLSKKYKSQSKGTHIPFKTNKSMTGTARYCSINTHLGYEQSRRDDLESIGYVLLYFLKGSLPWQGLKLKPDEDQYTKICEKKQATPLDELCNGYPSEFVDYIKYCRELPFEGEPDYDYLLNLFKNILEKYCGNEDPDFDWDKSLKSNGKPEAVSSNSNMNIGKYKNKSMLIQNKSTNSQIYNKDETAFSPGFLKNGNSIFKKDEQNEEDCSYDKNGEKLQDDNEFEDNNRDSPNRLKSRTNSKKPGSRYNSQRSRQVNGEETNQKRFSKFSENHYNFNNYASKSNNIHEQSDNRENQNQKNLFKSKTEKIIEGPSKKAFVEKTETNYTNNGINGGNFNVTTNNPIDTKKKKNSSCHCLVF